MSRYSVAWTEIVRYDVDIEADSEAEALEAFWQRINRPDPSLFDDVVETSEPQRVTVRTLSTPSSVEP